MIATFLRRLGKVLIVLCMVSAPSVGSADDRPVLSLYGDGEVPTTWSLAQLRALPAIEIETTTPFTDGLQRFVGVALLNVLGDVDPEAILTLGALNDYSVSLSVAELLPAYPIIAYERNGAPMSVRDKGPLWVVYPFDQFAQFQNELTYSRSIWQLTEIRIVR